eukprot:scaffold30513_cov123-Isochrysis_galbana.AAC.5
MLGMALPVSSCRAPAMVSTRTTSFPVTPPLSINMRATCRTPATSRRRRLEGPTSATLSTFAPPVMVTLKSIVSTARLPPPSVVPYTSSSKSMTATFWSWPVAGSTAVLIVACESTGGDWSLSAISTDIGGR